ncbi:MAG: hypothetical protein GY799_22555 [Desulfobulbaceae bacterium]|nr:hypothetical protein [Desulfobulbaceae bacterium]
MAIRAIDHKTFRDAEETLRLIEHSIQRIPAKIVQIELYAQFAASAYRCDCTQYAKQIIRTKIIPQIKKMPPGTARNTIIDFSLPVIFEYDQSEAKELVKDMSIIRKSLAWNSVVLWSLCRSYLGDHEHVNAHTLRVTCDSIRLKNIVIAAASEITNDDMLCDAIEAITNSIRASFNENVIDQGKALDLLRLLEDVALEKLPDERNIQHEGYRIEAQAIIHGVRSYIFRCLERARGKAPRGLTKQDIRRKWEGIISEAHTISTIADRVLVLALIARHYRYFYDKERVRVKEVLQSADEHAQKIPTLLDRLSRFEVIGEAWDNIQETKHVRYIIEKAFESVQLLRGFNADRRLRFLVQTAYKLNPTLAEELVAKLDKNRYPNEIDNPASITFQVQRLVKDPSKLEIQGSISTRENILGNSSKQLMSNLVSGMDNPRNTSILEQWMAEAVQYHPRIICDVTHWVLENLHRKQTDSIDLVQPEVFMYAADLAFRLAEQISPAVREGLPTAVQDSFPVLNKKIMSFSAGESEYAQKWLRNWLSANVKEYLKICDPYFGKDQLDYLRYLPEDCQIKIFVITTGRYLDTTQDSHYLREELRAHWQSISSRSLPNALFLVVPKKLEDSFHDRAIITLHAGLNIGQSLNGMGRSRGNITILNEEEAKELEDTYLQNMLNSGNWFMGHGVSPVMFRLRE